MTATARRLIDIKEVSRMLAARIVTLAPELLPKGARAGHEWVLDEKGGDKISVHLSGGLAGVWKHWNGTGKGDALDLVAYVLFGEDKKKALEWSLRWLGLESGDPRALETVRRATPAPEAIDAEAAKAIETARNNARRIWLAAEPRVRGTPVDTYLTGRGIDLAELHRQPGAIRYHPSLWNKESERKWPAMVTAVTGPVPGGWMACHRTWLEIQRDGRVTKAPLKDAKMTLGSFKGGHISLWRGASDKPLRDAEAGETVDLTEGIENGLSVALCAPELRVLAAVTMGNLPHVVLPEAVTTIRVWKDNDVKPSAIAAFDRALRGLLTGGRTILIAQMPKGIKDVNDLLQANNE
jgi:hypothetical protein